MKRYFLLDFIIFILISGICIFTFGENKSQKVNAYFSTVLIDPGHGGQDNGAVYNEVKEDDINLSISNYLYEYCSKNNYMVFITREGDYDLASEYASNRKREDLNNRVRLINSLNVDLFVSIHLNSYRSSLVHGPMVYYKEDSERSKSLAISIQNRLNDLTSYEKNVHKGDYFIMNYTIPSGVIIECGFLSNEEDRNQLISPKYQAKMAKQIFLGINDFLEIKKG